MSFFEKLKAGLAKTKSSFDEKINQVFKNFRKVDEELLEELKQYPSEDVYIIGGDSVYKQMIPYCDVAHVTKIDHAYAANKYFFDLDKSPDWEITAESDEQTYFDIAYEFLKYERKCDVK